MNDPRDHGLDELGQRLQALGGPAVEPRPTAGRESYASSREYPEGSNTSSPPSGSPRGGAPYQNATYPDAPYRDATYGDGTFRGSPLPVGPAAGGRTTSAGIAGERAERYPAEPVGLPTGAGVGTMNASGSERPGVEPGAKPGAAAGAAPYTIRETGFAGSGSTSGIPGPVPGQGQAQLPASTSEGASKGGFQRLAQVVRTALPYVQKLLPLLDGNLATAVGALLAPQGAHAQHAPPVTVDLEPVERQMGELRTSQQELSTVQRELRDRVAEQGATLKGVEDQLERVREATDRNTLEQQELVEDLRSVGSRMSRFAVLGLVLLAISVGFNLYLLILLQHLLR